MEVAEGVRSEPVVNCVCEVEDKHVEGGRSSSSIDPLAGLLVVLKPFDWNDGPVLKERRLETLSIKDPVIQSLGVLDRCTVEGTAEDL